MTPRTPAEALLELAQSLVVAERDGIAVRVSVNIHPTLDANAAALAFALGLTYRETVEPEDGAAFETFQSHGVIDATVYGEYVGVAS